MKQLLLLILAMGINVQAAENDGIPLHQGGSKDMDEMLNDANWIEPYFITTGATLYELNVAHLLNNCNHWEYCDRKPLDNGGHKMTWDGVNWVILELHRWRCETGENYEACDEVKWWEDIIAARWAALRRYCNKPINALKGACVKYYQDVIDGLIEE